MFARINKLVLVFTILFSLQLSAQFRFKYSGERAIYDEQIWVLDTNTISFEINLSKELLFKKTVDWAQALAEEDPDWIVISGGVDNKISLNGVFEFLYNKNGSVARFPAHISFDLLINEGQLKFIIKDLKTRYGAVIKDSNFPNDVHEKYYSLLVQRPFREKKKKLKAVDDYVIMQRVEYYLNRYLTSLYEFVQASEN